MPLPLAIPLAMAGAGVITKAIGAIKAGKSAKQYEALANQLPEVKKSAYVDQMIGTAQNALNANPLQAATQRMQQGNMANAMFAARSGDRASAGAVAAALSGQASDAALKSSIAEDQMREARRQSYYNTLNVGMEDEQNVFANKMSQIQSKASLLGAAAQTRSDAWNSVGQSLIGASSAMLGSGFFGPKAAGATTAAPRDITPSMVRSAPSLGTSAINTMNIKTPMFSKNPLGVEYKKSTLTPWS
jgi:hypothetical protein